MRPNWVRSRCRRATGSERRPGAGLSPQRVGQVASRTRCVWSTLPAQGSEPLSGTRDPCGYINLQCSGVLSVFCEMMDRNQTTPSDPVWWPRSSQPTDPPPYSRPPLPTPGLDSSVTDPAQNTVVWPLPRYSVISPGMLYSAVISDSIPQKRPDRTSIHHLSENIVLNCRVAFTGQVGTRS